MPGGARGRWALALTMAGGEDLWFQLEGVLMTSAWDSVWRAGVEVWGGYRGTTPTCSGLLPPISTLLRLQLSLREGWGLSEAVLTVNVECLHYHNNGPLNN